MGWGSGEDEEAGAILKVHEALGIFYFGKILGLLGAGLCADSVVPPSPYRFLFSRESPYEGEGTFSESNRSASPLWYSDVFFYCLLSNFSGLL